jgi:CubicO group peptidase (beta-lactamase class C family)
MRGVTVPDPIAAALADLRLAPRRVEPPTDLPELMARCSIPGVGVAVIAGGRFVWAGGFGVRSADRGEAVGVETMFQAGSISKPVAALCALRLVAEGTLALDEEINERLRSWRVPPAEGWSPRPTLRQLLSHTGGLTVHGFPGYPRSVRAPDLIDVLEGRGNTPAICVRSVPGLQFSYSGGGYCVLQQLLIDVTGEPFPKLARALVLEPLDMRDSSYEQPLPRARRARAADGHRTAGRPVDGGWHVYPEMAAAGLWTTPSDLARFVVAIHRAHQGAGDALLPRHLLEELLTPQASNAPMGLGLLVEGEQGTLRFRHGGDDQGFVASLVGYAALGAGAVVMTNSDDGSAVIEPLLAALARAYQWPEHPGEEAKLREPTRAEIEACTGTYEAEDGYRFRLQRMDTDLALLAPGQEPIRLAPASSTEWHARALLATVRVTLGRDGRAASVRIEQAVEYAHDVEAARLDG